MSTTRFTPSADQPAHAEPEVPQTLSYGYGYFFRALRDYQAGELTRTEVLLLEYFIGIGEHFLKKGHTSFWHSYKQIHEDTFLAIDTIQKKVAKFKELGILSVRTTRPHGVPTATFTVRYQNIVKHFNLLFGPPAGKTKEQIARIKQRRRALFSMARLHRHLRDASWMSYED